MSDRIKVACAGCGSKGPWLTVVAGQSFCDDWCARSYAAGAADMQARIVAWLRNRVVVFRSLADLPGYDIRAADSCLGLLDALATTFETGAHLGKAEGE